MEQVIDRDKGGAAGAAARSPFSKLRPVSPAAGIALLLVAFVAISTLLRGALLVKSMPELDVRFRTLAGVFATGGFFDLVTACYFVLPWAVLLALLPSGWLSRRWFRRAFAASVFAGIYLMWFSVLAEWLFWDEFGARFNFIAVDYLIYTREVVGNIGESYPVPMLLAGVLGLTVLTCWILWRFTFFQPWLMDLGQKGFGGHWGRARLHLASFAIAPLAFTLWVNARQVPDFGNTCNEELARNGLYSLCAEFRNNELRYEQFYDTVETPAAFARLRRLLAGPGTTFVSTNLTETAREVCAANPVKNWNVLQITVESLSAEFLGAFGSTQHLTPHLDALAEQSLLFTNFYATGTRTVRGMEALTLSLPPTPGQSIVRRPQNEDLFSLGAVFRSHGYDTAFIYGGYGYFDNMNAFFSGNGYRVVDRAAVPAAAITFANAWGACDEDVFEWSLREADAAFARRQPFHHFVMTTSNHRPYTYPEGRIDIPPHTGRAGAIKYTDYAIGQFIAQASTKPWFTNTLFVIVADHCASSAGRADLPIRKFEIPMLFYNPSLLPPRRIGALCSQIDYPPTLLALMNWSYPSRFFGKDILRMTPADERAFIGTYQKLGLLSKDRLVVLKPLRRHDVYEW